MAGVTQSSCLSSLLFTIYINNIPTSPGTKLSLFADDTMFYHTSMGKHHAAKKLQNQVDLAVIWLKNWRLTINTEKTVGILFGDKSALDIEPIQINGQNIKWQKSVKYLGVKLDSKLTFNQHIIESTTKAHRIRAALYPIFNYNSPVPIQEKITIIKMYINTILTYAGPAWEVLISKYSWKKLEVVQNIALRTITGTPWYVRNDVLRRYLYIKTIQKSIISASRNMFHKTLTSQYKHLQDLGLSQSIPDWRWTRTTRLLEVSL